AKGYFAWSVRTSGEPIDELPAPDGEEYFATALYFAAARWGNSEGIYNYAAEADQLLTDILHRETITGLTRRGPVTAVNLFDEDAMMVRFTPHIATAAHTDPSYHLPAFYEIWARVGPQRDREFWLAAAQVSRDYFLKATHPDCTGQSGLLFESHAPRHCVNAVSGLLFESHAPRHCVNAGLR